MPQLTRRDALKLTALTATGIVLHPVQSVGQTGKLAPTAFKPLPLGAIRPAGWLQRQLRIQADGMGGHLDEFWPDVGPNSGWLGGTGESWERGPYFLDGLIPLAVLLDDPALKAKAQRFVEWTLTHQSPDGMIGPPTNNDWWPRMVMAKALIQHHEATADPRVLTVLTKYFHHQLEAMPSRPLKDWGKFRWQDEVHVLQWLHDRTQDPRLLELSVLLQQQGFNWTAHFEYFPFQQPTDHHILDGGGTSDRALSAHGVNNGHALKTSAVQFRMTGDPRERDRYVHQIGTLDQFHGLPNGMFSCDEHLSGRNASQGSELCTVVESMFSMEVALSTFGDPTIADRIEKLAYNALPGTFTDDMWAHQYDQQPNQVQCSLNTKPWSTNGTESNLYGLEPHFGCCTANFHQGWPKFTASLFMATPDGSGLAATLYAPCVVTTRLRGGNVRITVDTDYPFRDTVKLTVALEKPARFPLLLRIPAWATNASIQINGKPANAEAKPGTFATLHREWRPGDTVDLRLPMQPRVTRWVNNSIAIERGPLVFSHDPGTTWVKLRDRKPTADWQVFPTGNWNYALNTDEISAATLAVTEAPVGPRPFAANGTAVQIHVPARKLDTWRSEDGVAKPVPQSPVTANTPDEPLTLIPYAAAKLRITAFPQLKT